jgi:hypothetical protein
LKGILADEIGKRLEDFGDVNIYKDTDLTCYLEFYFLEPSLFPVSSEEAIIKKLLEWKEKLGIE